jgi:hypothetical protein
MIAPMSKRFNWESPPLDSTGEGSFALRGGLFVMANLNRAGAIDLSLRESRSK